MSNKKFGNSNIILNRVREAYDINSDIELARFLTVNPSTLATWRKTSSMKFDRILAAAGDINMNWLFYGEGPKWKSELGNPAGWKGPHAADPEVPYYKTILPGSGGGITPEKSDELVFIGLPGTFIYEELEADPADLFVTRSTGDGMKPTINDRDFILVHKSSVRPYAGRIYLIRIDESLLCKRIHERPGKKLALMSDNTRYEHLEIVPDAQGFEVVGRVVWHGKVL